MYNLIRNQTSTCTSGESAYLRCGVSPALSDLKENGLQSELPNDFGLTTLGCLERLVENRNQQRISLELHFATVRFILIET